MKIPSLFLALAVFTGTIGGVAAQVVFSDTFDYGEGNLNQFTTAPPNGGGWTSLVPGGALGDNFGTTDEGRMWGNPTASGNTAAGVEYNHPTALAAGEVITMNADISRGAGYQYGMRVFLWDGSDDSTRVLVAGDSQSPTAVGALNEVSYTVTPADITEGRDHVIFRYSHDGNWGETDEVSFAVDPPPSGFTWDNPAGGSWATPGDWTPAGPAEGADEAALIHFLDISGDTTITLDGSYTIGELWFADVAGDDGDWILDPGSGGVLTLSAPTNGSPGIDVGNRTATVNAELAGTEGLTKTGSGSLVLGTANTYTGGTFIESGTVAISDAGAIPSGAGAGDVTLEGTLDLADTGITLNGLSGGGNVTNSGEGTPTLTIGADDADGLSFSGAVNDGSGVTSLVKTGTGTQTLTGIHGLSGTVRVEDGTLVMTGGFNRYHNVEGVTVGAGARAELNGGNMFVGGHGEGLDPSRELAADDGTLYFGTDMESRIGNVSLSNGATWTIDRGLAAWDVLLGDTAEGAATVTVASSGGNTDAAEIDGGGGLHLQGVQKFDVADVTGDQGDDLVVSLELAGPGNAGGDTGGIEKLGAGTMRLRGTNSYTGDTVVSAGELVLEEFGILRFAIGADGVTNKVTGPGTAFLDGDFEIGLANAEAVDGNTWTLVDVANVTYGPGFFVYSGAGDLFTGEDGVHTYDDGTAVWTFTESTGKLTVEVEDDYLAWAAANGYWTGSEPNTARAEDFDGDGVNNEDEWAFGLNPTDGASVSPYTALLDVEAGTFTYTRRDPALTGLDFRYAWSTTLVDSWTPVEPAVADVVTPIDGTDNQEVTVDLSGAPGDPLSNPTLFIRVEATAP